MKQYAIFTLVLNYCIVLDRGRARNYHTSYKMFIAGLAILSPWAQLFKTNDVVKTLIIKYGIYANIFAQKNVSSFCICKSYSHFSAKIPVNLVLYLLEQLTI